MEIKIPSICDIRFVHDDYDNNMFINSRVLSIEVKLDRVEVTLGNNDYDIETGTGATLEEAIRDAGNSLIEQHVSRNASRNIKA